MGHKNVLQINRIINKQNAGKISLFENFQELDNLLQDLTSQFKGGNVQAEDVFKELTKIEDFLLTFGSRHLNGSAPLLYNSKEICKYHSPLYFMSNQGKSWLLNIHFGNSRPSLRYYRPGVLSTITEKTLF